MNRVVVSLVLLVMAACADVAESSATSASAPSTTVGAAEYLPGLSATVHLPVGHDEAPVVVMVPGGGWLSADPSGLDGLARHLAAMGVVAAPVEIRAARDGVLYPVPVEDAICATAHVARSAVAAGVEPSRVVVLGHSSGAHLAALAALTADRHSARCPDPFVPVDGLIGIAGTYDVREYPDLARRLFGSRYRDAPETWDAGNPVLAAGMSPEMPVLLIHRDDDELVPPSQTKAFSVALQDGGHEVTVQIIDGADHHSIYQEDVSGDVIVRWLSGAAEDGG